MELKRSHPEVKKLLAACYPDYTGRKVTLRTQVVYHLADHWDGGTRRYVRAYNPGTGEAVSSTVLASNPLNRVAHAEVVLPRNLLLVEHAIFCGRDLGINIYVHPDSAPRFLAEVR